jgi:hypothetical protein
MASFAPFMYRVHVTPIRFPAPPDPLQYSNLTRPAATIFPVGSWIFNTDDNAPNYSDGTVWRDANGDET